MFASCIVDNLRPCCVSSGRQLHPSSLKLPRIFRGHPQVFHCITRLPADEFVAKLKPTFQCSSQEQETVPFALDGVNPLLEKTLYRFPGALSTANHRFGIQHNTTMLEDNDSQTLTDPKNKMIGSKLTISDRSQRLQHPTPHPEGRPVSRCVSPIKACPVDKAEYPRVGRGKPRACFACEYMFFVVPCCLCVQLLRNLDDLSLGMGWEGADHGDSDWDEAMHAPRQQAVDLNICCARQRLWSFQ